ncbi:Protein archease [subsurface metagenome]
MEKFKFLEHTADIKFQAFGKDIEEAFENAALTLKKAICEETEILEKEEEKIEVEGKDFESLLYNFLEEFLFLVDGENFLLSKIKNLEIDKKNFKLNAIVSGDKANNYEFTNKVKAVTYNEMFVRQERGKWVVQVVLDV